MKKIVTLGEIMLRLSTTDASRLAENALFAAHYGGGEANVAISLANYGHQVSFASLVPENPLGLAVKQHLQKYGVDCDLLKTGGERLGTYYLETGIGLRSSNVVYDRKYSSFSAAETFPWDFEELLADTEVLLISGITPALSPNWRQWTLELAKAAKACGVKVGLDINYRGKLWSVEACGAFVREIAGYVDYLSAARLDALNFFKVPEQENADLSYYYQEIQARYPNIELFYSTTRKVYNANHNHLIGNLYQKGQLYTSSEYDIAYIVDRVGGGDAYTGGIFHGILSGFTPEKTVEFATLASAMKHTVAGDHNQFSATDIEELLISGVKEIKR
ncbi:sugar kinase [Enterococcus asini]|uniref:sugar kinase n=1 Tax=Enterococcus asini TaxID=57732 RepID=UPI0028913C2D|nr:sugar kinase [Enterococcus asini]MDT2755818.1 sugar kinase [Enterococcus asini]